MKLRKLTAYLQQRQFVAGQYICYVDFIVYELLELLDFITKGKLFAENKTLAKYYNSINEQPFMAAVKESLSNRAFFSPEAKLNFRAGEQIASLRRM